MTENFGHFSTGYYFQTLTQILGAPRSFFRQLPEQTGYHQSFGFLLASALFSAAAAVMTQPLDQPLVAGGVYLVNAVGMAVIAAGLGYMVITMVFPRKTGFRRIFSIYAMASGTTLLAAWIPLFIWITEPWKWILIGIGLSQACGLKWMQSILVVAVSMGVIILFFWSLAAMVLSG